MMTSSRKAWWFSMASDEQITAANYLAECTRFYVKRITQKAVILHCSDPNVRFRVGPRAIWRQARLISRNKTEWINIAQLKLNTKELARRAAQSNPAKEGAGRTARSS